MQISNVNFELLSGHLYGHLSLEEVRVVKTRIDSLNEEDKLRVLELSWKNTAKYFKLTVKILKQYREREPQDGLF